MKILLKVVPVLFVICLAISIYFALDLVLMVACYPDIGVIGTMKYFFTETFGGKWVILMAALYITWGVLIEKRINSNYN